MAFEEYTRTGQAVPFRARTHSARRHMTPDLHRAEWLWTTSEKASGSPDVVAFVSDVLTDPPEDQRATVANIIASTRGHRLRLA